MSAAGAVWTLTWRRALRRRRLFLWNVTVPLLLLLPVALSPAAAPHRSAVYAIFFVFFGTFGGCIPLVREGESGWVRKVLLTGVGARPWLTRRIAAHGLLDLVQLLPATALIALAERSPPGAALLLAPALLLALLTANLVGAVVAAAVRSLAEGALVCAAVALLGLHLTGVFRAAPPESGWRLLESASPLRPLHLALESLSGTAASGPAVSPSGWLLPLAAALLLFVSAWAAAPLIGERVAASGTL